MGRRAFLRSMVGVAVGAEVGAVVMPVASEVVGMATHAVANEPVGNAGYREVIKESCEHDPNPAACQNSYTPKGAEAFDVVVAGPIREETIFRAVPSVLVDTCYREGNRPPDSATDVLARGTQSRTFTRAEFIGGALSSFVFGQVHNITPKGYDKKNIPTPQTLGGVILWGLARKFGLASSVACHMAFNARVALFSK